VDARGQSPLGSTAGCGKPHVRWCGRADGRNPVSPTRSGAKSIAAEHDRLARPGLDHARLVTTTGVTDAGGLEIAGGGIAAPIVSDAESIGSLPIGEGAQWLGKVAGPKLGAVDGGPDPDLPATTLMAMSRELHPPQSNPVSEAASIGVEFPAQGIFAVAGLGSDRQGCRQDQQEQGRSWSSQSGYLHDVLPVDADRLARARGLPRGGPVTVPQNHAHVRRAGLSIYRPTPAINRACCRCAPGLALAGGRPLPGVGTQWPVAARHTDPRRGQVLAARQAPGHQPRGDRRGRGSGRLAFLA